MKRRKSSYWCLQAKLFLPVCNWLQILSAVESPWLSVLVIKIFAFVLTSQTIIKQLFGAVQRFQGHSRSNTVPLEWLFQLHFQMAPFISFFTVNILSLYFFSQFFSPQNYKEEQNMYFWHKNNFDLVIF